MFDVDTSARCAWRAGMRPSSTDKQGMRVLISTRNPAVPGDDRHAAEKLDAANFQGCFMREAGVASWSEEV